MWYDTREKTKLEVVQMVEDTKRTIAFICPVCRQPVLLERSVFQLAAASGSRLPCPCGKSEVDLSLSGNQVRLTVPCLFCEEEHTVSCSTAAFLGEKTLAFSCANSGLDCCYVGEEDSVFGAMKRLEETVDGLESEAGARGTFLNDLVMEEILGELKDIAQRDGIVCTCGSHQWNLQVNYSSVEVSCARCGGAVKIPAATLSDIEDLCCKPILTIHGKKPRD
jgi:hypothetical protein